MLRSFILGVHILLALMIIGLVLVQRGKGAEAGARVWIRRVGHGIRRTRHGDVVLEADRDIRGAFFRDQLDACVPGDTLAGRGDFGARTGCAGRGGSAQRDASRDERSCRSGDAARKRRPRRIGAAGLAACDGAARGACTERQEIGI